MLDRENEWTHRHARTHACTASRIGKRFFCSTQRALAAILSVNDEVSVLGNSKVPDCFVDMKVVRRPCDARSRRLRRHFFDADNPLYEATSKVFAGPRSVGENDVAAALQELLFSRELTASYAEVLRSRGLAEQVIEKTGANISPAELTGQVETRTVPETRIIEITVTQTSPRQAQRFANEIAADSSKTKTVLTEVGRKSSPASSSGHFFRHRP